jgi:hypothetical protein
MPVRPKITNRFRALFLLAALGSAGLVACGDDDGDDATATLSAPEDGATVAGGVGVTMTADGVTIEEAGEARDGAGHFHVLIDEGCVDAGTAVPRDADHVHFGKGQDEGTVYVGPGTHELCLQVADGAHAALDITDTITFTAAIADEEQWCSVIGEVDDLFKATDEAGDDFAAQQVGYENVRRLIAQLDASLDVLDADIRDDIATTLATGTAMTTAFIDADDFESAVAELDTIDRTSSEAGVSHIADRCNVDIDG